MRMSIRPGQKADILQMNLRGRLLFLLAPPAIAAAVHAVGLMFLSHGVSMLIAAFAAAVASGVVGWYGLDEPFACIAEPMFWLFGLGGLAITAYAFFSFGMGPATYAAIALTVAGFAGAIAMVPITSQTLYDGSPSQNDRVLMSLACLAPLALATAVGYAHVSIALAAVGGVLLASCAAVFKIAPAGQLSLSD